MTDSPCIQAALRLFDKTWISYNNTSKQEIRELNNQIESETIKKFMKIHFRLAH